MLFTNELLSAVLKKRHNRFLADVTLADGSTMTAYCPNTGSMRSCSTPGSKVLLSRSENTKRKYPYTLEMVRSGDTWVGVNTGLTNQIVVEAIKLAGKYLRLVKLRLLTPRSRYHRAAGLM
jgi:sugar fermentation stimulation protein A